MKHITVPPPSFQVLFQGYTMRDLADQAAAFLAEFKDQGGELRRPEPDEAEQPVENGKPVGRAKTTPPVKSTNPTLDELHPSARTTTVLAKVLCGYADGPLPVEELRAKTLVDVIQLGRDKIAETKGAGPKVLSEIDGWLDAYGYGWTGGTAEPFEPEQAGGPPEKEEEAEPLPPSVWIDEDELRAGPDLSDDDDDEDDEDETDQTPFTFDWAAMRLRGLMEQDLKTAKEIGVAALRKTGIAVANAAHLPEEARQTYADHVREELLARELPL